MPSRISRPEPMVAAPAASPSRRPTQSEPAATLAAATGNAACSALVGAGCDAVDEAGRVRPAIEAFLTQSRDDRTSIKDGFAALAEALK